MRRDLSPTMRFYFRRAWQYIPRDVQRQIRAHVWAVRSVARMPEEPMLACYFLHWDGRKRRIWFSRALEEERPGKIIAVILHELAHAFLDATTMPLCSFRERDAERHMELAAWAQVLVWINLCYRDDADEERLVFLHAISRLMDHTI